MDIEITIEGPLDAISRLQEKLRDLSPELRPHGKHQQSLRIIETENGLDSRLLFISRALKGMSGLELRVRNLAYSEPVVVSSDEPFRPVGSLLIQPWHPFLPETPDPDTIVILQQHAFGSGLHPTTILCLKGLEEIYREGPSLNGKEILDFGCGTGLLAIAAVKWGAQRAFGVEIDPASVLTARRNANLNRVAERITIVKGSWDAVGGAFDVIIANLVPAVIYRTGKRIRNYLRPQGRIIVSGFGDSQAPEMESFFTSAGLFPQQRTTLKGWGALTLSARNLNGGQINDF